MSAATAQGQYGFVLYEDFESYNGHQSYNTTKLWNDFPTTLWQAGISAGRGYISGTAQGGSKHSLKITYPAYQSGSSSTGAQFQVNFPNGAKYTELYCEYDFRFSGGFQWKEGGKMPGLGGGGFTATGGTLADGYNGFSSRLMWRKNGTIAAYVYRVNRPAGTSYGEDFFFEENGQRVTLSPNRWYRVKMRVRLNQVGSADGRITCWLDGTQVLDRGGIEWRKTNNLKIDNFMFSTFPGGGSGDSLFYPTQTQQAWFDNLHCFTWGQ
ncbi:MAG: polysaccharide lyase [Planctomycetota bacterium]